MLWKGVASDKDLSYLQHIYLDIGKSFLTRSGALSFLPGLPNARTHVLDGEVSRAAQLRL